MPLRVLILVALAVLGLGAPVHAADAPVAQTRAGAVSGVRQDGVSAYLGIPFAAPPVGPNRWRAPQPVAAWSGVRPAERFGPSCWQAYTPKGFGPWTHEYVLGDRRISEDCLYLNVWTPAKAGERRPVLVWIYGGGFNQGSSTIPIYDGAKLAAKGVVVVSVNYRFGVFGFLAHPELTREAGGGPPANWGLQDMVAALKWVRANITAFGGDPDQVTLAGQSAGAIAVNDLVASPLAAGLFQRAIAESGLPNALPPKPLAAAEVSGQAFARAAGAQTLAQLRAMSPAQLSAVALPPGDRFAPVVDGVLLPEAPLQAVADGRYNRVPMLVGYNADEGSAFSTAYYDKGDPATFKALLSDTYGAAADRFAGFYPATTDAEWAVQSRAVLRDKSLTSLYDWAEARLDHGGPPTYAYLFDYVEPGPQSAHYRSFHSSEIPYIFDTLDAAPERGFTSRDQRMSDLISRYWIDFIRTGDPNGGGLARWPELKLDAPEVLQIDLQPHARPLLAPAKLQAMKADKPS